MLFEYVITWWRRDLEPKQTCQEKGIVAATNYSTAMKKIETFYIGDSNNAIVDVELFEVESLLTAEELKADME